MTTRARRVSQTIIEAEAKSLDDSTKAERGQAGLPIVGRGLGVERALSPGLELYVLDGDAFEGGVEVVDGANDGDVQGVGEYLGGERVWSLDEKDAAATIEGQGEEQKWAREQWGGEAASPQDGPICFIALGFANGTSP